MVDVSLVWFQKYRGLVDVGKIDVVGVWVYFCETFTHIVFMVEFNIMFESGRIQQVLRLIWICVVHLI